MEPFARAARETALSADAVEVSVWLDGVLAAHANDAAGLERTLARLDPAGSFYEEFRESLTAFTLAAEGDTLRDEAEAALARLTAGRN